jgi:uncharacterized protein (TIGR03790 family)
VRRAAHFGLALAALALPMPSLAQSSATLRAFGIAAYSLQPRHVAVVVNERDPDSVAAGQYYVQRRRVPPDRLLRVGLPLHRPRLTREEFGALESALLSRIPAEVQVVVLAWTTPYAVDCNSITSALTLGYDPAICASTCGPGRRSAYFDAPSVRPRDDLGRPLAMLLPVESVAAARNLVDRGVTSDRSAPAASAYLLSTSDGARNARAPHFPPPGRVARQRLSIQTLEADAIEDRSDIMFYLTGTVSVPHLETLGFLPGALADHLTSFGGELRGTRQMSALRWIEAGATASYGTVSEPCSHWQKFPHPAVLLKHYLAGASAVEAYWKSVAWPAQGLFIGEPLAAPYARRP